MKYKKLPLGIDDQIHLLRKRGMEIPDPQRAARYLFHISYFRLRGYWIPFEKKDKGKDHQFIDGTTFDDVLNFYLFDRKFRLLIMLNPEATRYVGNTVIMLGSFFKLISPGTSWPHRMQQLISLSPGIQPAAMGFQKDWKQMSLWNGIG